MTLQEILTAFVPYWTQYGIGQANHDLGDSSQRWAIESGLMKLSGQPLTDYKSKFDTIYQYSKGVFRRNSDPTTPGYLPTSVSRDQLSILKLSMAINGDKKRLWQTFVASAKRLFFHQNYKQYNDPTKWQFPDVMVPSEWGVFIRGLNAWYLYPLLLLLDVGFLVDYVLYKTYVSSHWDVQNMTCINLLYANLKYKTPVSMLALYLNNKTEYMTDIYNYYREDNGNNGLLPMYELYNYTYQNIKNVLK